MFLYDESVAEGIMKNLARQKLEFKKNSVKSLKKCQSRFHVYMHEPSGLRSILNRYIKAIQEDFTDIDVSTSFYRSKQSEAYYFTFKIERVEKKLRIANHDTVAEASFDECLWLSDCPSMKTLAKRHIKIYR